ncbi:MAG: molybdate ABC transporter substrate-binding protein [Desulfobulbus sp.]|nr:molybdate ABC transporter substrate-binding protein [Desulfobulbus sp.]
MSIIRSLSGALALCLALASASWAGDELIIASGAGYKRLVNEACAAYTAKTGLQVQQVFGNMGQIVPQAKESGNFDFVLGDKTHLDRTDLAFSGEYVIGKGKLVVAVAKESKVRSLTEITGPEVTRVAMPDSKKAIYGHAATEYLQNKGLWDKLQPKLLIVGTVPQVSAYVVSGEVDMGFINLTEAMAIEPKVARLIPVDEQLYSPILIVAKRLQQSPHTKASEAFIAFLQSDAAKAIAKKHGL